MSSAPPVRSQIRENGGMAPDATASLGTEAAVGLGAASRPLRQGAGWQSGPQLACGTMASVQTLTLRHAAMPLQPTTPRFPCS
jgi:hypothetical protein